MCKLERVRGRDPLEPIVFDWIWIGLRCPYPYEDNGVGRQRTTRSGPSDFGKCAWVLVGGDKRTVDTPRSVMHPTQCGDEDPFRTLRFVLWRVGFFRSSACPGPRPMR